MKVFVYGALQRGQPNSHLFDNTKDGHYKYLGVGITVKKYPLVIASRFNIPFMLHVEDSGNRIKGEVYDVNEPVLDALDELEGHPNFYRREVIPVTCEDGSTLECGCYFLLNFRKDLLELPFHDSYHYKGSHNLTFSMPSAKEGENELEERRSFLSSVINI
ncbi:putative gamma-glutamylcyclotransferase CG2811 [Ylistrum balloti]|uniref:putative gamma-glutamylcyclotransferase CG2811 n=1 Tax=Ylistrum balloti TaxID=509963 RepID=UPI002905D044|nr:putative gamma-glutamylcyclotransferase CG2811 [Ylistrum balloti]